jgi:hypothetical protein
MREWLPEMHMPYCINYSIARQDLQVFHTQYAMGVSRNQSVPPTMMGKGLNYAYASGVFSSCKLVSKLHEYVTFRPARGGQLAGAPRTE